MTWVLPLAMLVVTAVLLLQGCAVLILEPGAHARFAGAATILLAAIGYLSYALLATGALVISPEFDIAMVQGVPAACAFAVILIGGLVAAGTAWHASRCVRRPSSHAWWIVALSVCIGVAALLRVRILNPFDPLSLRIGCYDLWWPAPVVWLSLCLSGWITARLERTPLCAHVCAAALLSAALAAWAVHRSHLQISYINPETRDIWQACVLLALPAAAASGALLAIDMVGIQRQRLRRLLKIVTASLFASASLIAAAWWLSNPQNLSVVVRPGLVVLMSLLVLALALAAAWRLIRYLRSKSVQLSRLVILTLAAVIAGALIERFHFAQVEPKWVLAGFLTLGIVSIECLGGGPLAKLVRWNAAREVLATTDAPLHTFLNVALAGARRLLRGGANVVQNLVPGSLILKTVAIVLALLVLAQIGDAGKTIIVPFSTIGLPAAEKDLGQIVSDRIANTVGVLGQELRPELLVFLPALTPDSGHVEVAVGSSDVGAISASAKTGMLEIPGIGVQIPLALVASPIVSPVRRLLRIRVIQGSIQKEGGHYTLLAGSTNGESWRELGAELNRGTEIPEACAGSAGPQPDEELTALADKIAYDLISTVPNFSAARMSRSACAITLFRSGSYYWRQFELAQDFAALSNSIALLNEAVRVDPKFALAHYRLGRALIADRQPWSAVKAFRAALQASPDLAAAHVALAETLYNLNAYKYTMPPALLSTVDSNKYSDEASADSTESAQREAWLHWSQVAQLPTSQASVSERASAYNGLCLSALFSQPQALLLRAYAAFFYCKRAEILYSGLSDSLPADKSAAALSFTLLGIVVETRGRGNAPQSVMPIESEAAIAAATAAAAGAAATGRGAEKEWYCSDDVDVEMGEDEELAIKRRVWPASRLARQALAYFRYAEALAPEDPQIRCAAASTSQSLGDRGPIEQLRKDPAAHKQLAQQFETKARKWFRTARESFKDAREAEREGFTSLADVYKQHAARYQRIAVTYYRFAINEYQKAIDYSPTDLDALNGYAYAFWVSVHGLPKGAAPDPEIAERAEAYARLAVRLVAERGSRSSEAEFRSTLGEVLLARGHAADAVEQLETARRLSARHAVFNEIRWDLALAYLCSNTGDPDGILREIRDIESSREVRPFTEDRDLLDRAKDANVCGRPPEE